MLITAQPLALARENGVSIVVHDHAVVDLLVHPHCKLSPAVPEAPSRVNGGALTRGGSKEFWRTIAVHSILDYKSKCVVPELVDTQYNASRRRLLTRVVGCSLQSYLA
jgi:hypothetical protein